MKLVKWVSSVYVSEERAIWHITNLDRRLTRFIGWRCLSRAELTSLVYKQLTFMAIEKYSQ